MTSTTKKFLEFVFSAKNEDCYKVITILGVRFKFKLKYKVLESKIKNVESKLNNIESNINNVIATTGAPQIATNDINTKIDNIAALLMLSVDIRNIPKSVNLTGKIQQVSFGMLKEFDRVCRKYNLKYWLDYGTMLGAKRHRGFVPWDDDIDVGMMYDDYCEFLRVFNDEFRNTNYGLVVVPSQIGKICHKQFMPSTKDETVKFINWELEGKLSFALDIFPFYNLKKEISKERARDELQKLISRKSKCHRENSQYEGFLNADKIVNETRERLSQQSESNYMFLGTETMTTNPDIRSVDDMFPLKELSFEEGRFYVPKNIEYILTGRYGDYMAFPSNLNFRHIKNDTIDKSELQKLETILNSK